MINIYPLQGRVQDKSPHVCDFKVGPLSYTCASLSWLAFRRVECWLQSVDFHFQKYYNYALPYVCEITTQSQEDN